MSKIIQSKMIVICFILLFGMFCSLLIGIESNSKIEGMWRGGIEIQGEDIPDIVFQIFKNADGVLRSMLESPDQTFRVVVDSIMFKDNDIRLILKSMNGTFEGKLKTDDMIIEGQWQQGEQTFPLTLKHIDNIPERIKPQDPKRPYPYIEEEVIYENKKAGIKLVGILSYPAANGYYPAVLLIDGSGLGDRNDIATGQRSFQVLADHLTRQGIAVLTVDKRGVWRSTGDFSQATTEDFAHDVFAGIEYLKNRRDINSKQIGLVGLSEGAMIAAMIAAQSSDVAFLVEMAGPGKGLDEIMVEQKCLNAKAEGASDENISILRNWYKHFYTVAKTENDDVVIEKKIRDKYEKMTEPEKEILGWSERKLSDEMRRVLSPWWRYLLNYDPQSFLMNVKCPVLAINGSKDQQVVAKENLKGIEEALKSGGNKQITILELEGLNHNFQNAETGAESEYAKIAERMAPSAMDTISVWVKRQIDSD